MASVLVREPSGNADSKVLIVTPGKLLRLVEIAELLGVSKQRADQLRRRPDFPAPVDRYSRGDLWAASDVKRWARTWGSGEARWGPKAATARRL